MTGKTWMSALWFLLLSDSCRNLKSMPLILKRVFGLFLLSSLIVAAGALAFAWFCCNEVGKQFVQLYFPSFPVVKETLQEASPMEPNKPRTRRPAQRIR